MHPVGSYCTDIHTYIYTYIYMYIHTCIYPIKLKSRTVSMKHVIKLLIVFSKRVHKVHSVKFCPIPIHTLNNKGISCLQVTLLRYTSTLGPVNFSPLTYIFICTPIKHTHTHKHTNANKLSKNLFFPVIFPCGLV